MSQIENRTGVPSREFRLDRVGGKIGGVCSGIANYFNIDPLVVRLVFAVGAFVGVGTLVVLYLAIWALAD
jgi:phage shock protein C